MRMSQSEDSLFCLILAETGIAMNDCPKVYKEHRKIARHFLRLAPVTDPEPLPSRVL